LALKATTRDQTFRTVRVGPRTEVARHGSLLEHDVIRWNRHHALERFPAKWIPVRVKKTRQNKRLELRSDSIGTEKALALCLSMISAQTRSAFVRLKGKPVSTHRVKPEGMLFRIML
jgi:hypothetical protein